MVWSSESRHKRGYDAEWVKTREKVLRRDFGMCQCEVCKGRGKSASAVHHIVPKADAKRLGWTREQTDALSNLISMNQQCHDREHGKKVRVEIGADGWPKSAT